MTWAASYCRCPGCNGTDEGTCDECLVSPKLLLETEGWAPLGHFTQRQAPDMPATRAEPCSRHRRQARTRGHENPSLAALYYTSHTVKCRYLCAGAPCVFSRFFSTRLARALPTGKIIISCIRLTPARVPQSRTFVRSPLTPWRSLQPFQNPSARMRTAVAVPSTLQSAPTFLLTTCLASCMALVMGVRYIALGIVEFAVQFVQVLVRELVGGSSRLEASGRCLVR